MAEDLKPLRVRLDPGEVGLVPVPVVEAMADVIGLVRVHAEAGLLSPDVLDAIAILDEKLRLWQAGELFTTRTPKESS